MLETFVIFTKSFHHNENFCVAIRFEQLLKLILNTYEHATLLWKKVIESLKDLSIWIGFCLMSGKI